MSTETQNIQEPAEEAAGEQSQTQLEIDAAADKQVDAAAEEAARAKAKAEEQKRIDAEVQKRVKKELEAARKAEAEKRQKDEERAKLDLAERLKVEKAEAEKLAEEAKAEADEARRNLQLYREMSTSKLAPVKDTALPMLEEAFGALIKEGLDPAAAMKKLAETHDFLLSRVEAPPAATRQQRQTNAGPTLRNAGRQPAQRERPKAGASFEELAAFARARTN